MTVPLPRRLKITAKILEAFGTTDGCAQCTHVRAFRETKPGLQHGEICRKWIVEAMAATDAGAHKLERYEDRVDRALASRIGSSDADAKREQAGVEDNDLAALRGSVRLGPHPSEQAREEVDDGEPYYPQAGDSEDEAMGETLTIGEIKHRMRIQRLSGPHPCDGRVPSRSVFADGEDGEDEVTAVLAVI